MLLVAYRICGSEYGVSGIPDWLRGVTGLSGKNGQTHQSKVLTGGVVKKSGALQQKTLRKDDDVRGVAVSADGNTSETTSEK